MANDLKKIMYIEDEPDIRKLAEIALQDLGGYTLKCCSTGKEALVEAPSFNPDLFLIDVMMPEMDGPTTLTELKKNPIFELTPFIFMTAKTQASEVDSLKKLGATGIITKPFDPMALASTIKELWDKYHAK